MSAMPMRGYFDKLEKLNEELTSYDYRRQNVLLFMDQFPSISYVKNAETFVYEQINAKGAELYGKPIKEILGKSDLDLFPLSTATVMRRHDLEVLARGSQIVLETFPVATDGRKTFLVCKFKVQNGTASIGGIGLEIPDQFEIVKVK